MIYLETMNTMEHATYNFRIWKLVHMLYHLHCISEDTYWDHVGVMDGARRVGIAMDLDKFTMSAGIETIQF